MPRPHNELETMRRSGNARREMERRRGDARGEIAKRRGDVQRELEKREAASGLRDLRKSGVRPGAEQEEAPACSLCV